MQARVDKIHGLANSLKAQAKVHVRNNTYAKKMEHLFCNQSNCLPLQETQEEDK